MFPRGCRMSLIHSTIVGHFDPSTLTARNRETTRPINVDAARVLLAQSPQHVASRIEFHDGYVECWWVDSSLEFNAAAHEYAYRLAELEQCIVAETPVSQITYPEDAKLQQMKAWQGRRRQAPSPEPTPHGLPTFAPPKPGPCPYCCEQLRTAISCYCRHCKMDWHDPANIHHRATTDRR